MRESSSSLAMASATTSRSVSSERALMMNPLFRRVLKQDRGWFQSRNSTGAPNAGRNPDVRSVLRAGEERRPDSMVAQIQRRRPGEARGAVHAGEEEREKHENTF